MLIISRHAFSNRLLRFLYTRNLREGAWRRAGTTLQRLLNERRPIYEAQLPPHHLVGRALLISLPNDRAAQAQVVSPGSVRSVLSQTNYLHTSMHQRPACTLPLPRAPHVALSRRWLRS